MRVEDVSVPAAELLFRALLDGFELSPREPDCGAKPAALSFEICFGNLGAINIRRAFLKPQHTTNHDAIRHTEPFATQLVCRASNVFALVLLGFIKITREETDNRFECFLFVLAAGDDLQIRAATGRERQYAEYRLGISFGVYIETLKGETAFEPARNAYEVGGGASVKTEAAGDLESAFSHFQSAPAFGGSASKAPAR